MIESKIDNLKQEIIKKLDTIKSIKELNDLKVIYLGKKGPIQELTNQMKNLSVEEKKEFGK